MTARRRGGGGRSSARPALASTTWPAIAVLGGLLLWAGPAPVAAQPPPPAVPSGAGITPGAMAPAPTSASPDAAMPDTGGAQPSRGGLPALPGVSGEGGMQPPSGGPTVMPWAYATGGNQPPPVPMPPRADLGPQVVGPLPIPAVVPLPAASLDHYGDGAGTVGAGLIWMGQLPEQYRISRYHDGDGKVGGPIPNFMRITPHASTVNTKAELGYGPPGLHPGFYGFGLSFHPGYGYGGNALGVGALGGYPCYGGPGYPLHYGYPKFAYPYYEGIGQLYYDQPVVITDQPEASDFGPYTGASAYAYTHPSYAAEAAATGSIVPGTASFPDTSATNPSPEATFTPPETAPPGARNREAIQDRYLGMAVDAVALPGGRRGLSIVSIVPASTAENAGLHDGDVIFSVNGQPTQQRGDLARIVAGAAPGSALRMVVSPGGTGQDRTITIQVP